MRYLPALIGTCLLLGIAGFSLFILLAHLADTPPANGKIEASIEETIAHGAQRQPLSPRPDIFYAAIGERPIFEPSRRPVTTETAVPVQPVAVTQDIPDQILAPPPEIVLHGVMADDRHRAALLSIEGAEAAWIEEGANISDWILFDVSENAIQLRHGDQIIRIGMYQQ